MATDHFYDVYAYMEHPRGTSPFDQTFLDRFRRWRHQVAEDIATSNPILQAREVGRRTQRLLNALLFVRVCEDRNIGRYEDLLRSAEAHQVVGAFRRADRVFNAGMFDVLESTTVSAETLAAVIRELYWPKSKFAFGVLRPDILAAVYEQYLSERVVIAADRRVRLVEKPELTHAGGVVPTPEWVVGKLLDAALAARLTPDGVPADLSVLDPACGSGVFLVAAFERLIAAAEAAGEPATLERRARLVKDHLYGVDLDSEAVEVTRLSLLLAVLGDEVVDPNVTRNLLPDLSGNIHAGNTLIGTDFDRLVPGAAAIPERRAAVAPLDLRAAFEPVMASGGFTVIVGNPPYTRIQTLSAYLPDQLAYFQEPRSGYRSAQAYNFDTYMLFIERVLTLLAPKGTLSFVVSHRFTTGPAGMAVRELLGPRLARMVHFGAEQVFDNRTTYTCLIEVGPATKALAVFELAHNLRAWLVGAPAATNTVDRTLLTAAPWPIASQEEATVFAKMEQAAVARLGDDGWVHIFVGVQTSADDIYFVKPDLARSTDLTVAFTDVLGRDWQIERGIVRDAIRDQRIFPYDMDPPPDALALFPYVIESPDEGKIRSCARVLSAQEMAERYPMALAYLTAHEAALRERNVRRDLGDAFWAYGRSQSLTKLSDSKIIVRVLSLTPCYATDNNGLLAPSGGNGGPYYLLRPYPGCPLTLKVLVALLSHPAVDAYVAAHGKAYRGSYVVHMKAFLAQVPVPPLSDAVKTHIETAATEVQLLVRRLRSETDTLIRTSVRGRCQVLRTEIEALITRAFGLSSDDVDRVTG